jgi:hypothetical protein
LRRAALAIALLGALVGAAPALPAFHTAQLEQTRGFCAAQPTSADTSVADAVNASGLPATNTPPIAILDTGIDASTPELAGRVLPGWDALGNAPDGDDVDGHGTQVAGIAAGALGRVQGVSPGSPVLPVRIYNGDGTGTTASLVNGINWAVDNGASVINISSIQKLADASDKDVNTITTAIDKAFNRGVLVVAPVGNEGNTQADMPAALPHVLTVGASDTLGSRASFSNAVGWVDLVAPGNSLVAPSPKKFCDSGYGLANGTSYAAPAVAGAAALLAKMRPDLTAQERFDILRTSARDVGLTGRDDETGFGMLDVARAISAQAPVDTSSSPEVDDDPYFVRGPFAAQHPTLLARTKKVSIIGQLSRAKDPADVYPVRLKKNERLTVSAKAQSTDSLISLSIWSPSVGDFDVTNDVGKNRIVSTGGFANDPVLKTSAKKSGTYYVSVEATDLIDEDLDTNENPPPIPVSEEYTAKLSKVLIKRKPVKKKTTKKKKKSTAKKK